MRRLYETKTQRARRLPAGTWFVWPDTLPRRHKYYQPRVYRAGDRPSAPVYVDFGVWEHRSGVNTPQAAYDRASDVARFLNGTNADEHAAAKYVAELKKTARHGSVGDAWVAFGAPAGGGGMIEVSDALDFLQALPDGSVPMFLFSPPYNLGNSSGAGMRSYGHYPTDAGMAQRGGSGKWKNPTLADGYDGYDDALPPAEYKAWQQQILAECWRCLPDTGAIFYVHKPRIQDGVCATPLDYNPGHLIVRQIVIWARAGGFNWNPTYYCPTHEWIVIFAKPSFRLRDRGASVIGDVWKINQELDTWHPAPFPIELAMRALETTMPALVCDPFSGSGTTARAAKRLGIGFIGCDRNAAYVERANQEVAKERRMTTRQATMTAILAEQESFL